MKNLKLLKLIIILLTVTSCLSGPSGGDDLMGPDIDGNGVRDDIDKWINENISDANQRKALFLESKYERLALQHHSDKEKSIEFTHKSINAFSCFSNLVDNFDLRRKLSDELHRLTYNNKKRIKAYANVNSNFSGQVGYLERDLEKSCEFKLVGEDK